jgi:hypothetical protein
MLWGVAQWIAMICILVVGGATNPGAEVSAFMFLDEPQQGSGGAQAASDAGIAQRLVRAEAVISGTVTDTAAVSSGRPPFLSTHDPNWWQATVSVESTEKGKVDSKSVKVLFSNSADVAWYRCPKLAKGDHVILLLQSKDAFGKPTPGLAVVDPLDVRPIAELPKVRELLHK